MTSLGELPSGMCATSQTHIETLPVGNPQTRFALRAEINEALASSTFEFTTPYFRKLHLAMWTDWQNVFFARDSCFAAAIASWNNGIASS
jgi:hypothetical protein